MPGIVAGQQRVEVKLHEQATEDYAIQCKKRAK